VKRQNKEKMSLKENDNRSEGRCTESGLGKKVNVSHQMFTGLDYNLLSMLYRILR
jgi:hypothetical protein